MSDKPSIETPLKRARFLGSAHSGLHHWWMQRVTAIGLVPLVIWFAAIVVKLVRADHFVVVEFFKSPLHAVLMALFIVFSFYHSALGLQVVIEDYIHRPASKLFALIVVKFGLFILGIITLAAIVKMHLAA